MFDQQNLTLPGPSSVYSPPGDAEEAIGQKQNGGSIESVVVGCEEHYDYYQPTEKWLLGVVALPFILCGLCANGMSVAIFSHRQMRQQSVNWYLLVLGFSDLVILLGAFFVLTLPRLSEILHCWSGTAISYYSTPLMYSLMTMAQTTSVWMTVAMSLHRFVGVCFPYQSGSILGTRNVKSLIIGIILVAVMFNGCRFFEVSFQVCRMKPINVELPVLRMTALRQNELYRKVFYEWAYTLIMFVIPFTILIVVNSMVILAIHKSRKIHAKMNAHNDGVRKQELAKEISTSIMLVAIVIAFLLCNTLTFVVNLMEKLDLNELYVLLVPWSNMLVLCNASINICIYCIFSDRYRNLLLHYLHCCRRKGGGDNTFNVNSMSYL